MRVVTTPDRFVPIGVVYRGSSGFVHLTQPLLTPGAMHKRREFFMRRICSNIQQTTNGYGEVWY